MFGSNTNISSEQIERGYQAIVTTIGDLDSLHSYESAGIALMKYMLSNDDIRLDILEVLKLRTPPGGLTLERKNKLIEAIKAALRNQQAEILKKCDYLISTWEKEIIEFLDKIREETNLRLSPSIERILIDFPYTMDIEPFKGCWNKKMVLEGVYDDEINITCNGPENGMQLLENNTVLNYLMKTYHKLKATYQIRNILVEKQNLTMLNNIKQAAGIYEKNINHYRTERNSVLRDVLYGLAILFAIPTAGITLFAAMIYSYKQTGTCWFFSDEARTSSNSICESLKDSGIDINRRGMNNV